VTTEQLRRSVEVFVTLVGISAGLIGTFATVRLIRGLLFGITPYDPLTLVDAPAVRLLTATIACVLPAWRASRTDPVNALRAD